MNEEISSQVREKNQEEEIKMVTDVNRLEDYDDLSGMTVKKLEYGLWWANNSKFIKAAAFWMLMFAGFISWAYTFYTFMSYIGFGIKSDNDMLYQMVNNRVIGHEYLSSVAPVDIIMLDQPQVITYASNKHDIVQMIVNQNARYFATFDYYFLIDGQATKKTSGFILANEQKYLMNLGYESNSFNKVQLVLENIAWKKIDMHKIPDWQKYYDDHLTMKASDPIFSTAKGSGLSEKMNIYLINFAIANLNPYNYFQVPINVLAYSGDSLVGISTVYLDNFQSGESRVMNINYPYQIDKVDRVEVVPDLNIMRDDIYVDFAGGGIQ